MQTQNEEQLNKVAREVGRVDLSDHILAWDHRQSGVEPNEDAIYCPEDERHGRLQMHGQGSALICCARGCNHSEPVSR